jgi:diguanylate cyclase (GGDEF)-like protein/PAS domain S-box-containing protein
MFKIKSFKYESNRLNIVYFLFIVAIYILLWVGYAYFDESLRIIEVINNDQSLYREVHGLKTDALVVTILANFFLLILIYLLVNSHFIKERSLLIVENYSKVLDNHFMVAEFDIHGEFLSVNSKYLKISEFSYEELSSKNHFLFTDEFDTPEIAKDVFTKVLAGNIWEGIYKKTKKSGEYYWVNATFFPFMNLRGKVLRIIAFYTDATQAVHLGEKYENERKNREELAEINRELALSANTDPLTDLFNRRAFNSFLDKAISNSIELTQPIALLMLDLDFFKEVNDHYGHLAGDQILVQVARRWKSQIRASDLLARIGGEEFCLVLPETSIAQAELVAQKIISITNFSPFEIRLDDKDLSITVTVSVGLVSADYASSIDKNHFLELADQALYESKHNGRNCLTAKRL